MHEDFIMPELADDRLFSKIENNPNHVLYKFLPEIKSIGYNLRRRAHPYSLPIEDEGNFMNRVLFKYSVGDTWASVFVLHFDWSLGRNYFITLFYELFNFFSICVFFYCTSLRFVRCWIIKEYNQGLMIVSPSMNSSSFFSYSRF